MSNQLGSNSPGELVAPYTRTVRSDGLRVLTAPMPMTRSVSVALYIGAGSRYEADEEAGVSHYLEHMFFKGTERRPTPKEVSETIERVGGFMNASTDREVTVYWARIARPHFSLAMDLLGDMLLHSTFEQAEIEKERQVILEELHTVNDVPSERASLMADSALWPGQALGRDVAGSPETVNGIDRDLLLSYMGQQYHPANSVLTVAGQVTEDETLRLADTFMSGWSARPPRSLIPAGGRSTAQRAAVEYRRTEQAHICLTLPGVAADDPDRYAVDLLNAILGEGMASKLFLELRENRGIVYEVSSSVLHLRDCGAMTVYAGTEPRRGPEAVEAVLEQLALAPGGVEADDLERAREMLKGRLLLRLEDTRGVSGWLGAQELLLGKISSPEEVVGALDAVTVDQVRAAASKLLRPDLYRLAVVGPYRSDRRFNQVMGGAV